ncbi:MAG: hypothetical protein ACREDS_09830, partial [Limisphaerales bacterium]
AWLCRALGGRFFEFQKTVTNSLQPDEMNSGKDSGIRRDEKTEFYWATSRQTAQRARLDTI